MTPDDWMRDARQALTVWIILFAALTLLQHGCRTEPVQHKHGWPPLHADHSVEVQHDPNGD